MSHCKIVWWCLSWCDLLIARIIWFFIGDNCYKVLLQSIATNYCYKLLLQSIATKYCCKVLLQSIATKYCCKVLIQSIDTKYFYKVLIISIDTKYCISYPHRQACQGTFEQLTRKTCFVHSTRKHPSSFVRGESHILANTNRYIKWFFCYAESLVVRLGLDVFRLGDFRFGLVKLGWTVLFRLN